MKIIFAYTSVVCIWATTPLAIHWSNTSLNFSAAIAWRIICVCMVGLILLKALRQPLIVRAQDWLNYSAGALALFPTMALVYWAAQSIASGLMSVIFGLFPFLVGVWSHILLRTSVFTPLKIVAVVIALAGLIVINTDQLQVSSQHTVSIFALLVATVLWALSTVWLKCLPALPPLRQSVGSAVVATPFFVLMLVWDIANGSLLVAESPRALIAILHDMSWRSWVGIAYLVIAGSLLGHSLFFYILNHCSVGSVALVPLITPVMALSIGWWLEDEVITSSALVGVMLILGALLLYQGTQLRLFRRTQFWFKQQVK